MTAQSAVPVDVLWAGLTDLNGNPLDSGFVATKAAGTQNDKAMWVDSAKVTPTDNPIPLDSLGRYTAYADGIYDLYVYDKNMNQQYVISNAVYAGSLYLAAAFTSSSSNLMEIESFDVDDDEPPAPPIYQDHIAGMVLSNDGSSPNTVLDISAGQAADSLNTRLIALGAFTKSTAGTWAKGTGSNGMGTGLTIAATTWYHVFAILINGLSDVYFDTSVSAANKPAGTTAFRLLGSFLTDGSKNIIAFKHDRRHGWSKFRWVTSVLDGNDITIGDTDAHLLTLTVPPGRKVYAQGNLVVGGGSTYIIYISDPSINDEAPSNSAAPLNSLIGQAAVVGVHGGLSVGTNTASQCQYRGDALATFYWATTGWDE